MFFFFLDNYIWIGSGKFSQLLREYSYLAVNLIKDGMPRSGLLEALNLLNSKNLNIQNSVVAK